MTILILGGTAEAAELARRLSCSDLAVPALVSLAGRTSAPKPLALPSRSGGFGGVEGLVTYLRDNRVALVIDATHPFAAVMPFNAAAACRVAGVPLIALRRPPWTPEAGDCWTLVGDMAEAVAALGAEPRRVFLTIGRLELEAFAAAPQHRYLVRSIEPIGEVLPAGAVTWLAARGPFALADEAALMRREGVEVLVTKNSGGAETAAKLSAARALGLPVIMVERPAKPDVPTVTGVAEVLAQLSAHGFLPTERGV
jgi:precorrin-6A/cobalt-precorrin-6A reductase